MGKNQFNEEDFEFLNPELQKKYVQVLEISKKHLKKLDNAGVDIRRMEFFLQSSGFGYFSKTYETKDRENVPMYWDKKLCYGEKPLIENPVHKRLEGYTFLVDFLESIASYHDKLGEKNESN